jgi:hypothetical protein
LQALVVEATHPTPTKVTANRMTGGTAKSFLVNRLALALPYWRIHGELLVFRFTAFKPPFVTLVRKLFIGFFVGQFASLLPPCCLA